MSVLHVDERPPFWLLARGLDTGLIGSMARRNKELVAVVLLADPLLQRGSAHVLLFGSVVRTSDTPFDLRCEAFDLRCEES